MRTADDLALVRRLVAEDLDDCEVARRTGIPRETIRDWRRAGFRPPSGRRLRDTADHVHDFRQLSGSYPYLLGLYLGDGNITQHPRGVFRLRVTLDERYPLIVAACQASMAEVMPASRASIQFRRDGACVEVYSFSKHWPCFLPQHEPGPKHGRRIALTDWQREICDRHPEPLLRGLIHSDGCRSINRIKGRGKVYAYPRYEFTNHSADIRRIFTDYLDALGIAWRPMTWRTISIAHRDPVATLDTFIGPKA